jgi:hypothetical protein
MVNESPRKLLAHNLCVLVQEEHELGIEPVFWKEGEKEVNGVARCQLVRRYRHTGYRSSTNCMAIIIWN